MITKTASHIRGIRLFTKTGSGQTHEKPIECAQVDGLLGRRTLYTGALDCTLKVYASGGVGVFYRGLLVNAVKVRNQSPFFVGSKSRDGNGKMIICQDRLGTRTRKVGLR
jgi:hypothetical protein